MTGILIVTHNNIGKEMLKTAETIVGKCVATIRTVGIPGDLIAAELGRYADQIKSDIDTLDKGQGVLILTDIFGATPSNLAHYFANHHNVKIVTGLNLPMLIRIINYDEQSLPEMALSAIQGANKGISKEEDGLSI
ncbi:MAG: PTS fructose transporter subunit IIA [Gammaproteobacteria bacterium]|nr:PTS fructose transporter subunit IIA [Gammaproteobacteria bacterium]MBL7000139.1 PTS fructose transporter subunit IIA [Gammaproteobacteria bacterium]